MAKLTVEELLELNRDRLQQERIAANREYIDDIGRKDFPGKSHNVSIDVKEL